MNISELLTQIYKEAKEQGLSLEGAGIYDDEDMIMFALRFLRSNLEDAIFYTLEEDGIDEMYEDLLEEGTLEEES